MFRAVPLSTLGHLKAFLIHSHTCPLPLVPGCKQLALLATVFILALALVSKACACASKMFLLLSLFHAAVVPCEPAGNCFSPM